MIDPAYSSLITGVLTSMTTVTLTIGGWVIAGKHSKKTEKEEIKKMLEDHKTASNEQIATIHQAINNLSYEYSNFQTSISLKFDTLTKQVEKHNNVIERTYELERNVDVLKERSSVANHRISDLEHNVDALQMGKKEAI